MHQLKTAPNDPGCYRYYNADISKSLRRTTDFTKWIEEEIRRCHIAFTFSYVGSEF